MPDFNKAAENGKTEKPAKDVRPRRKPRRSPINKAAKGFDKTNHAVATRVGLRPSKGLNGGRSFLLQVFLPSLFKPRARGRKHPLPPLPETGITLTWLGHASFLIRSRDGNVMIDPNWARWLKVVKRLSHPPLQPRDLPRADMVLVTHAHYDHLDKRSLRAVADHQPVVVPFAVGNLVHRLGFSEVRELDYWQETRCGGLRAVLTPCHHWGARVLHDRHRGFGGFIIEAGGCTIYHCGDSAFFDGFREIGQRFDIDVALMPIGAYDPPSGREVHMTPEQALQAFRDLGAKHFIPMHYGSFPLSFEPMNEPLQRLQMRARMEQLDICVLEEGQTGFF